MNRFVSYGAGIGYASIFGFSFLVTKGALDVLDPLELLFSRFLIAAVTMSLLAASGVIKLRYGGKPKTALALTCLFQPVLYFLCETFGVRESATSTAGMILGALPATVAVLGLVILKERVGRLQMVGLALSVAGVGFIVFAGAGASGAAAEGPGTPRGILLLIGAMASAAFFNVFSRAASRHYSDLERTFAMMWTGTVVFGIATLAVSGAGRGASLPARMLSVWPSLAYLGLLSSVVAFFLINVTLTRLKASQSATFANLVTVITVVAGVVLRGEPFGFAQAAGAAMIVTGVWAANRSPERGR